MVKEKYEGKAKLSLKAMGRILELGGSPKISMSAKIALAYILEDIGRRIVADAVLIRGDEHRSSKSTPVVKGRHIKTAYKLLRKGKSLGVDR